MATTLGTGSFRRAPKMLTVTPSMGNTHGVRFKSSPPANSARNQPRPPRASAASSRFRVEEAPDVPEGGALLNDVRVPPLVSGAAVVVLSAGAGVPPEAAAVTVTATLNGTLAGARQS